MLYKEIFVKDLPIIKKIVIIFIRKVLIKNTSILKICSKINQFLDFNKIISALV